MRKFLQTSVADFDCFAMAWMAKVEWSAASSFGVLEIVMTPVSASMDNPENICWYRKTRAGFASWIWPSFSSAAAGTGMHEVASMERLLDSRNWVGLTNSCCSVATMTCSMMAMNPPGYA